jgi:hypothetical protein
MSHLLLHQSQPLPAASGDVHAHELHQLAEALQDRAGERERERE